MPSSPQVASTGATGEKASPLTRPRWPSRVVSRAPSRCQRRTAARGPSATAASMWLSREKASLIDAQGGGELAYLAAGQVAYAHSSVFPSGGQVGPVRTKRHATHHAGVPRQHLLWHGLLTVLWRNLLTVPLRADKMPRSNHAALAAGREHLAVRAELNARRCAGRSAKGAYLSAAPGIVNGDRAVLASRRQPLAVRTERHRENSVVLSSQGVKNAAQTPGPKL